MNQIVIDGKLVGPVELIKLAKSKINDTLFICEHSKHKIPGMIVDAKKLLSQSISLIEEEDNNLFVKLFLEGRL